MPIRITGMNSGLDTESIISELVKAKSEKKDKLVKEQTKLQWKQDAWKELNSKVYSFYSKTLSNMRLKGDYYKKTTKVSSSAASVITGANAVNGVQTLKIEKLAKSGYLTGAAITNKDGGDVDASTTLGDLGITNETESSFKIKVKGEEHEIKYTKDTKLSDIVSQLKSAGVNANFDEKNNRFFVSATAIGESNDFDFVTEGVDEATWNVMNTLGLMTSEDAVKRYGNLCNETTDASGNTIYTAKNNSAEAIKAAEILNGKSATKIDGQDAKIILNGAEFTSDSNTFEINGLTITANEETDGEITLTTADDTEGIYDMIKDFLKEYNELINEMDKLYNADSSKGYEPLTDEEKDAMSEKEVEKWEEKIKGSILRRDSTLSNVAGALKQVMMQGVKVGDEQLYLSDFGIGTLGYFNSKENEKNAYHIDGDPDDSSTNTNADKLKTAIANDPQKVVDFFSSLSMNLYNRVGDLMKKTEYSSSFTLYDDVAMKNEYNDYKDKISKQEDKIADFEDRYYKKFSAMETALAKLQSKESAISGLFGM